MVPIDEGLLTINIKVNVASNVNERLNRKRKVISRLTSNFSFAYKIVYCLCLQFVASSNTLNSTRNADEVICLFFFLATNITNITDTKDDTCYYVNQKSIF